MVSQRFMRDFYVTINFTKKILTFIAAYRKYHCCDHPLLRFKKLLAQFWICKKCSALFHTVNLLLSFMHRVSQ